jgi:hypothetical protein
MELEETVGGRLFVAWLPRDEGGQLLLLTFVSNGLSADLPWALSYLFLKFIVLTFTALLGGRDVFLNGGLFLDRDLGGRGLALVINLASAPF